MIKRTMQEHIDEATRGFPVITITGPRQSGKTTLARMQYPDHVYLDLEDPDTRFIMQENPRSLLKDPQGKYIIDEFQYVPSVLSYVKLMVDAAQLPGQIILSGSNHFVSMSGISQSLAGRTAILQLLPLSYQETYGTQKQVLDEVLYKGFYPRLITQNMNPRTFFAGYIATYVERDIRLLSKVHDLALFHKFMGLCAGRTGCLLNKVALANETGIDVKTASNWISLLQTSYIIHLLQPWHANLNKRLVKSPKLYFYDSGLVCRLLKIRDARDLENHPLRGQIFETFIVSEYLKHFLNRCEDPPLWFYRESNGTEIDIISQNGARLSPIEIKSSQSFHPGFLNNIKNFRKTAENQEEATLIYAGDRDFEVENTRILPYWMLDS